MIIKGLSLITSVCVLMFIGAVGMEKLNDETGKRESGKSEVFSELKKKGEGIRKAVESNEVFNDIKHKAKKMVITGKNIAEIAINQSGDRKQTGLPNKFLQSSKNNKTGNLSEADMKGNKQDWKEQEFANEEIEESEEIALISSDGKTSSILVEDEGKLVSLQEIDSSLMRIGKMLHNNNF